MSRSRRPALAAEAERRNREQLARLGAAIRSARLRRRLSQRELAARAGIAAVSISRLERGLGGVHSVDTLQRVCLALGVPLRVEVGRDPREEAADAGHLAIQELLLRLARACGRTGAFELPTRPSDPSRSADVGSRDDRYRVLILQEAWNRLEDIGGGARSTARKVTEAEGLAALVGADRPLGSAADRSARAADRSARAADRSARAADRSAWTANEGDRPNGPPYRVASVWVLRATKHNRDLVRRYPEVFAARFPGSSHGWVRALTLGVVPPTDPGLVWCDVAATRLYPWRRR